MHRYQKLKNEGKEFEVLFLISEHRMYDAYVNVRDKDVGDS